MLKCASLYTYELDSCEKAYDEIKTQLEEKLLLLENSVGIVMCHTEFIHSGVLKYICNNLPFDVVGVTTASQSVNSEAGEMILTLFVMTADDVQFKTGLTSCLNDDIEGPTKEAYEKIATPDAPKLALVFPPLLLKYAGDSYVSVWEKIIPNTPVFGTIAIDDTIAFDESETIYNGENYKTSMSFVLCYGNINPRFVVGTLPDNNAMPYKGEVTKSNGPFVQEINNTNAYEYFKSLGLVRDDGTHDNFLFVPFVIDLKKREDYDGIPVMRAMTTFDDEGAAIFRGNVDNNSIFTMLQCMPEDVLATTEQKIQQINEMQDVNGVLAFSCIIRRMVLMGINPLLELESARNKLKSEIPLMIGYAGGEICPTSVKEGVATNRFHNYSLIMLVV